MRLIYADALKREPELLYGLTVAITEIQDVIDEATTVEERKHGHWIDIDLDTSICSVCKKPQEYETRYCPECGAIMDI
jgi:hypothetical protein